MFKPSKKIAAALGVATIAGTAGMVAMAPTAQAAVQTATINMTCDLSGVPAEPPLPPVTGDFTFSVEAPEKVTAGQNVTVKIDMGKTPVNSPVDIDPGFFKFSVAMDTTASGGATGPVVVTGEETDLPKLVLGEPIALPPFNASFTVPAGAKGDIDFSVNKMLLTAVIPIPCTVNGPAKLFSVKTDDPAPSDPTLATTPGEVKPGAAVTATGTNWPAGTPTAELCDSTGAACDPAKVTPVLTVTDGALSGTVTVNAGVADGSYQLKVKVGDKTASSPVSVKADVPANQRKAVATPNHGPVGTKTMVTGEGFTPNTSLYVVPVNAANAPDVGGLKNPKSDAEGKFSVEVTVGKPDTVLIAASEDTSGTKSAAAPFTVDGVEPPAGTLKQDVIGTITAGGLTISQEHGGIQLSDVTLNGTDQNMTGALNTVTVKDLRSGTTGWTLTGSATDFSNGAGGTIGADKFSWTPTVTKGDGSISEPVAGSAGPIGNTGATLASAPNAANTGGTFAADAGLSLAVPAYQAPGTYTGTLTLSIS
jgi:hypothetical protein